MVFSRGDADLLVTTLEQLLSEMTDSPATQATIAAAEEKRYVSHTAPIAALYAENAARIMAFASAASGAGALRASIDGCSVDSGSSPVAGGSPAAPAAAAAAKVAQRKSLLGRIWSLASMRSDSSMSSASEVYGGGPAAVGAQN